MATVDVEQMFSFYSTSVSQQKQHTKSVMLSPRGQAGLKAKFLASVSASARRLVLGLEHSASACPRTFYFGLVKVREMIILELVIIMCFH